MLKVTGICCSNQGHVATNTSCSSKCRFLQCFTGLRWWCPSKWLWGHLGHLRKSTLLPPHPCLLSKDTSWRGAFSLAAQRGPEWWKHWGPLIPALWCWGRLRMWPSFTVPEWNVSFSGLNNPGNDTSLIERAARHWEKYVSGKYFWCGLCHYSFINVFSLFLSCSPPAPSLQSGTIKSETV